MRKFLGVSALVALCVVVAFAIRTAHAVANVPTAEQPAPHSTPEQLTHAAECGDKLKADRRIGMWQAAKKTGTTLTVEVGPAFYDADFETKQLFSGTMECVATEGRIDDSVNFIDYLDARTHREVATWIMGDGFEVK